MGDSKKFYSDNILVEAEKQIIDNLKVFLTTCVNEKQELDTGYDICMRYMEQVTGVYPVSLENRVHTEILLHLEKFIRGKLKITCDNKFKELCVKPMQDICEVIITEEYMRKEQPYSLGNLIKRLVEEFMEKHEKAMLVPYGKEYFIKAILYFLKSTFNEENEKWCLVVSGLKSSQGEQQSMYELELEMINGEKGIAPSVSNAEKMLYYLSCDLTESDIDQLVKQNPKYTLKETVRFVNQPI